MLLLVGCTSAFTRMVLDTKLRQYVEHISIHAVINKRFRGSTILLLALAVNVRLEVFAIFV
jgi:hypothetical protein